MQGFPVTSPGRLRAPFFFEVPAQQVSGSGTLPVPIEPSTAIPACLRPALNGPHMIEEAGATSSALATNNAAMVQSAE